MLVLEKEVAFRSMDGSHSNNIEVLSINISDDDIINIKKAIDVLKENKCRQSIKLELSGFVDYIDDDEIIINGDWLVDVESFVVYESGIFYYAQNKWHSGDQIESDMITLTELGIK
jgi:hypothetical protein